MQSAIGKPGCVMGWGKSPPALLSACRGEHSSPLQDRYAATPSPGPDGPGPHAPAPDTFGSARAAFLWVVSNVAGALVKSEAQRH